MKNLMTVGCALCAVSAYALMEPATPESQGVSSEGILRFIDACEKTYDGGKMGAMHGFVIVRHGKVIAEGSWKPFDTLNETHMLFSHSKSFTSSAVGLLADEGRVDLDERVVEIFSNDVPAKVSDNLSRLRVRDLLTMNAGKKDDLPGDSGNWVREFLASEFVRQPGQRFRYDSDATYMLAAIVEKRSGERMMDYLKRKMFDRIGITKAWSTCSPQGIPCGGWGMNMTTREIARFGQLYLNRGKWEGEQVLSPFWVDLATARHTATGRPASTPDWAVGYGFQFWRCRHGAYRADGAGGQYTIILPELDMVVSANAGCNNFQMELNLVWDHLLPAVKEGPLPEDAAALARLRDRLANLSIAPKRTVSAAGVPWQRKFELKENSRGVKSVEFARAAGEGAAVRCTVVTRAGAQTFRAGDGAWVKGDRIRIDPENYEGLGLYIGEQTVAASCGVESDGNFRLKAYLTGATAFLEFAVGADGKLTGRLWGMRGGTLESK